MCLTLQNLTQRCQLNNFKLKMLVKFEKNTGREQITWEICKFEKCLKKFKIKLTWPRIPAIYFCHV